MAIVVVGGGLAGGKLVQAYLEAGGDEPITLVSADTAPPYHRPPLSKKVLRGESEPEEALLEPASWYATQGVDLRLSTRVDRVDTRAREAVLAGGERIRYDRLAVVSGARPRPLGKALTLRTIDDAVALRRRAAEAKTAIVIGSGFIGMETAASLTHRGVRVTLVSDQDLYGSFRTPALSRMLERVYRERGVELELGEQVADPDSLEADLVLAGIGVVPNTELLDGTGVEVDDGVLVNERYETSVADVYAAGDVARFQDPRFGIRRRIEHWSNANYQGAQLGRILAGADEAYDNVSSFFTEVFGITIRVHGALELAEGEPEIVESGAEGRLLAYHRRNGTIVAAVTAGLDDEAEAEAKSRILS